MPTSGGLFPALRGGSKNLESQRDPSDSHGFPTIPELPANQPRLAARTQLLHQRINARAGEVVEWQRGEREAEQNLQVGHTKSFESLGKLIEDLRS